MNPSTESIFVAVTIGTASIANRSFLKFNIETHSPAFGAFEHLAQTP